MSGDVVLDTSAVVAVMRQRPRASERLNRFARLWLPVIALGELELGVQLSTRPQVQRAALDEFLLVVRLMAITAQTAREYAQIRAQLRRAGTPIPENDVWIAALAKEHGWPLATDDEHFRRIAGLRLES